MLDAVEAGRIRKYKKEKFGIRAAALHSGSGRISRLGYLIVLAGEQRTELLFRLYSKPGTCSMRELFLPGN
jgi:hypothetical protein